MTSELYIQICKYLKGLIAGTAWEGHLYAVGGCCRDRIMGDEIKDIDLAVDMPDGGVKFARWIARQHRVKGQPVFFRRFGTARFVLKRFPDAELEIVQTRRGKYDKTTDADPAAAFGSLEEDSFRRDLTMNTLFYDISREVMIDPTGMAMDDIRNCRLRTPMDPNLTFDDDPLRILRCVRFSIKYSHEIPADMFEAMKLHAPGLDNVSRERIHNEFDKILMSKDPVGGLRLLDSVGALHMIVPELFSLRSEIAADGRSFFDHAFDTLDGLMARRPGASWGARMAALFQDLAVAAVKCVNADGRVVYPGHAPATTRMVRMIMRRMRYEGSQVADVLFFIDYHMFGEYHPDPSRIKDRQLRRLQLDSRTRDRFDDLMALIDADKASYASSMVHTDDLT
ncbi:MAG: hypothetical protein K2F71_07170, partial [Paramuribaculum sp.]|nr:hypothetical protein [Paramuribaculum sp.]